MLQCARRAYASRVVPSRALLRSQPARNARGTITLVRLADRLGQAGRAYSTAAAEDAVPSKKKVWDSVDEAIADVKSGDVLLSGGEWTWTVVCTYGHAHLDVMHRVWTLWDSGWVVLCSIQEYSNSYDEDTLIAALAKRKDEVKDLTAVSNNVGSGEMGLGMYYNPLVSLSMF